MGVGFVVLQYCIKFIGIVSDGTHFEEIRDLFVRINVYARGQVPF